MSTLIHHLRCNKRSITIHVTKCIVTSPPKSKSESKSKSTTQASLINPSNISLTGTSGFPYFPKGGPVPQNYKNDKPTTEWQPLGYVTSWGGMDVGAGMVYPIQTIDGLVTIYGGRRLKAELFVKRALSVERESGDCVATGAGGLEVFNFNSIIHSFPPFYDDDVGGVVLGKTWSTALQQGFEKSRIVVAPLIGAGCRSFPPTLAIQVLVEAATFWLQGESDENLELRVAVLDADLAAEIVQKFGPSR